MQKIVINRCYGGFGLSLAGYARYAELKGKKAYFFSRINPKTGKIERDKLYPVSTNCSDLFILVFTTPNVEEFFNDGKWLHLTDKEKEAYNRRYKEVSLYDRDIERNDPTLIQVVEEMGEKANGEFAKLAVVEIPDGIEWEIDEYDGYERIEEAHRSWG